MEQLNEMTAERCAELICIAISNKLCETWPCTRPALDYMYCEYYFHSIYHKFFRKGISNMFKSAAGYKSSKL